MKKIIIFFTLFLILSAPTMAQEELENMGRIELSAELLETDILKVTVSTKDIIKPVLGVAFALNYEKENLKFLKYIPENFLELGGDPIYMVQDDQEKQKIIFGETLRRDDVFPVGGGDLATLFFQIINGDQYILEFQNGVISTLDIVRQDLDNIVWENAVFTKNKLTISKEKFTTEYSQNNIELKTKLLIVLGIIIIPILLGSIITFLIISKRKNPKFRIKTA